MAAWKLPFLRRNRPPLEKQLARTRRRLWIQTYLVRTLWCWCGALMLIALWFGVAAFWLQDLGPRQRLGIAGFLFGSATLLGLFLTMFRAPSRLTAALLLDERCDLRERVTTSLLLSPREQPTAAAQALLADVNSRVGDADIPAKFPLRIGWPAGLAPTLAALLAMAAFYLQPRIGQATTGGTNGKSEPVANAKEIDQKLNELKKRERPKREQLRDRSEDLKKLDAELDQIANKPRTTKEQLKERIKDMTQIEERMQNREKEMAQRTQAIRQQLQQIGRMGENSENQPGPAKDLQKALSEGKFDKAREEIDRLAKKVKSNEMTAKEKEELTKQLENLQKKLERMAQQKDKIAELERLAKENKISKETLKKELEEIKKDSEKLKSLQQLAQKLGSCQRCLKKGDAKGASQSMKEGADQISDLDKEGKDMDDLRDQLDRLRDAKDSMAQGMQGQQGGQGEPQEGPPGNNPTPASGRRPLSDPMKTNSFDAKVKGQFDKGKIVFDGLTPGGSFRKRSTSEMAGQVKQASQEEPEAIDQQRIPRSARDMAKSYFKELGGIRDSAPEPPKNDKPK
jgi:septal ring factor EnvC (AmiA/AmiB activator)